MRIFIEGVYMPALTSSVVEFLACTFLARKANALHLAALSLIVLPLSLPAPAAVAQQNFVLKAACIGGAANTVTEVAAAADGTISHRRYYNSGLGGREWQVLGRDPKRVKGWLNRVDATKQRRATVPTTVDRNPCRAGSSRPCHILRRKGKTDYYACASPAVLEEMMDFNESTNAPRADGAFDVMEQWDKAFAASDIGAIVKLFAPDALLMADDTRTVIHGPDAIRKYFEDMFRAQKPRMLGPTLENRILSEDAVVFAQYSAWTNAPEGQTFPDRITFVVAKSDAGWRIVHLHSSATPK
jgi:uncharacterized protein (TIGR02246 family)